MMSGIKGKNTKPELRLRQTLHASGFRFRLHRRDLPGTPDIVLPRHRVAIFVNGCFWHRHKGCRFATIPATRAEFWEEKFRKNVARDQRNLASLGGRGWRVAVVWECALSPKTISETADRMISWISTDLKTYETLPY